MAEKYRPNYADPNVESDRINVSGRSARENVRIEEADQRAVAESEKWFLARSDGKRQDSRPLLEKMGFQVQESEDDLFYTVEPPPGWTKSTEGYHTRIVDEQGSERLYQFYKGASYDRRAFIRKS